MSGHAIDENSEQWRVTRPGGTADALANRSTQPHATWPYTQLLPIEIIVGKLSNSVQLLL